MYWDKKGIGAGRLIACEHIGSNFYCTDLSAGLAIYVTGPASLACGSCHRAALINEDSAQGLALFNRHIAQYGYMVEVGEKPLDTLNSVWDQITGLFK